MSIHDSIVTTVGNEEYVKRVILEEIGKATGLVPKVSMEYWLPDNLNLKSGVHFWNKPVKSDHEKKQNRKRA